MGRDSRILEIEILKEKKRRLAKSSFIDFIEYCKNDYSAQWFHKVVASYLDDLSDRKFKRLMIFMPPQHGKSEMSSRNFPAYLLGKNPNEKIILGSYNMTKANEFVVDCLRIMKSEEYSKVFPGTVLNGAKRSDYFEVNGGGGFLKGAGMDSGVTGTSASCEIIDDPFKGRNESNSETIRNRVWNTYSDDFETRMDNNSIQLMLFTRWHEDDLAGRILDAQNQYYDEEIAKQWKVLVFTALKEKENHYENAEIIKEDKRKIDEALWEEKHSANKYIIRRRTNPTGFASLDQQRPSVADGNKIKKEWFVIKKESELPFNPQMVTADFWIDGAFTDKTQNDETALLSSYFNKADGNLYVFNCIGVRKELYELLDFFKAYAKGNNYKPTSSVHIELKASGHPLKSMLSKIDYGGFNTRGIDSKVVGLGKFNRVENAEPFLASGRVVLVEGGWNKAFINQCSAFPNGVHDDMVDVLTYAIHHYLIKKPQGGVSYA